MKPINVGLLGIGLTFTPHALYHHYHGGTWGLNADEDEQLAGAVMAIEDGYVVAAFLDKYFDDPATAFARYEEIRRERTATVVRKAHENRRSAFSPALAYQNAVAAEVAREWQQERVRERMEWLYAYDATAIVV